MQPNLKHKNGELPKGQAAPAAIDDGRHVRTQTAQESLGLARQSGLVKASLQAGVLFAIVFSVLTFVPYLLEKQNAAAKANAPANTDKADPTTPTNPISTQTPDGTPKLPVSPNPKISGKEEVLIKGGETGTKTGNPKPKDPFKSGPDDDLLK